MIGSIVAIFGIELLKHFVNDQHASNHELMWVAIIHLTLVFSGVPFALMDRIIAVTLPCTTMLEKLCGR